VLYHFEVLFYFHFLHLSFKHSKLISSKLKMHQKDKFIYELIYKLVIHHLNLRNPLPSMLLSLKSPEWLRKAVVRRSFLAEVVAGSDPITSSMRIKQVASRVLTKNPHTQILLHTKKAHSQAACQAGVPGKNLKFTLSSV
jgi:hypothetical protein